MTRISAAFALACAIVAVVAVPAPATEQGPALVKRLRAYPYIVFPGDPEFDGTYRETRTYVTDKSHDDRGHPVHIVIDPLKE